MDIITVETEICPIIPLFEYGINTRHNKSISLDVRRELKKQKWIVNRHRLAAIWVMNICGIPDDIILLIIEFAYPTIANRLKYIFETRPYDDTVDADNALFRFMVDLHKSNNISPCVDDWTKLTKSRLMWLCLYVNEYSNIKLEDLTLKGTITCLGLNCIRPRKKGDCCHYNTVTARKNIEHKNSLELHALVLCRKLIDKTYGMSDDMDGMTFDQLLDTVTEISQAMEIIIDDVAISMTLALGVYLIRGWCNSLEDIDKKIEEYQNETIDVEERKDIIRCYINSIIMDQIYQSDDFPEYFH